MSIEVNSLKDAKIAGQFQLALLIGKGSFGQIHMALNYKQNQLCAVKLENARTKHPQLKHEAKILDFLKGGIGMPQLYWKGPFETKYFAVAMELLGPSLEDLFNVCDRQFSMKTVIMIVDQMIARLQYLHNKNFIHRDVKPDNFLIGLGRKSNILYIIDFGLSKKYRDMKSHQHIPYRENNTLTGTARYASVNAHLGIEQSRRDDMEGIGYVIVYLLKGWLPWQGIKANNKQEKYHKIMEKKMQIPVERLCQSLPIQIPTWINYIQSIQFEDKPDYRFLRKTLRELFFKLNFNWDYAYDWTKTSDIDGKPRKNLEYCNRYIKVKIDYHPKGHRAPQSAEFGSSDKTGGKRKDT